MTTRTPNAPDGTKTPSKGPSAAKLAATRRHVARSDDAHAFVSDPAEHGHGEPDDLAEELAEEFLTAATSGEPVSQEARDVEVPEDAGGPFVVSPARREFARGTDASNPIDAEVEAFPTATAIKRR